MKKYYVLLACIGIMHSAYATNEESFLRGNKLYGEQQYAQALDAYQAIDNKGQAVWYNMGNCAYRLGNYKQAQLYWNLAQRMQGYATADSAYNLQVVQEQLGIPPTTDTFFTTIFVIAMGLIPLLALQILFLSCWIFLFYIVWRPNKYRAVRSGIVILTVVLGLLLVAKYYHYQQRTGFIVKPSVTVFVGPDTRYPVAGTIAESDVVILREIKSSWCKVQSAQLIGWIPADTLVVV